MVRILLLQQLYNLSDEQLEFQLLDRLSFQRFAGLRQSSQIPDRTTVWIFRERLHAMGATETLFVKQRGKMTRESGQAYRLKTLFNDFWGMPTKAAAHEFMIQWCAEVRHINVPAFEPFIKTLISHWYGILHFIESKLTNGLLEGINHKMQLAKRRARGYRNIGNFINMVYFLCGKLKFGYPLYST